MNISIQNILRTFSLLKIQKIHIHLSAFTSKTYNIQQVIFSPFYFAL